ncbi:hypothetical protein G9C98_000048 [Cotesia typhae]|uniref:Gamma-tubulin complex component 6 n=1 Tax=Cotesia typhae TaxID=2053667 RepID=A0A8J5R519_9HYME|nr:hypothetical protein G9C98_000048 [Cotesia typhae]
MTTMDSEEGYDFFGLVNDLCQSMINKCDEKCLCGRNSVLISNKLRSIAFEILLKKHPESCDVNDTHENEAADPVVELLKYSFVLKTTLGLSSKAEKLETALDRLLSENNDTSFKSILFFLHYLQSYQSHDKDDLEVFHFEDRVPKDSSDNQSNEVPHYQIYPLSAFMLPQKMDRLIDINNHEFTQVNITAPISFSSQLQIEIANNESKSSLYTLDNVKSMGRKEEECNFNYEGTALESLWKHENYDSLSIESLRSSSPSLESVDLSSETYEDADCYSWETLGCVKTIKQRVFALESDAAIQHLQNLRNLSINLSESESFSSRLIVISMKEFMENVRLVLLGIDSSCFIWDDKIGFFFNVNTQVTGLSKEALESISVEITHWATCFKLLMLLVRPHSDTGKYKQDGLIFHAMCNSVNDVLIHYQASVLQIFSDDSIRLIDLLNRLRYVGCSISEVARLCRCENVIQTTLAEGTGILTHIYDEVTKITKPDVALVFYSVLKSCCEVYFELMEKWIFEGIFDENYGEFMIFVREKYIRNRGHKFWTKCFGISKELVPGFLINLTDSILQCGKAVRLLKICDPKNPLCNFFLTARPKVKVCLSVNMLAEQEEICQRYMNKGMEILGSNITLSSALKELRTIDKDKAEHVIAAQQETLSRIKKSQEEAKLLIVKNKRELFADQKKQVEDAVSRREKAKEADLLEDKLLREIQIVEEEKVENQRLADINITLEYYKDLAEEAEKQRLRASWRSRRMELFDERVSAIVLARQEDITPIEEANKTFNSSQDKLQTADSNVSSADLNSLDNFLNSDKVSEVNDENCNETKSLSEKNQITKSEETTRVSRPTVLEVISNKTDTQIESIIDEITGNRSFKRTKFSFNTNTTINNDINAQTTQANDNINITFIDNEGNESKLEVNLNNDNNKHDDEKSEANSGLVKNLTEENNVIDAPNYSNTNEINDATPMSCTTDSYVPSAMSNSILYNCTEAGSIAESKNDFETPTTPGDCLPRSVDKQEYSMHNIFSRSSSQFFSTVGAMSTPLAFESSLTQADVEMIDNTSLQVYLEKSVLIPLRVQSRLANSAIVKCLLHDHKILSHLHSLRSFFFLLNGEFAKNLTGPLYTKFHQATSPDKLFNSATLTSLLKNAFHFSLNNSYKNSELLSLTVMTQPTSMKLLDPEALDCLCLHYKVSWPLNIILDEAVMYQYGRVFRFLIMVGRVLWFMTALHGYFTCSVLHSSCTEFEKELENAMTLDQIYSIHVRYIKKILSRCMMTRRGEKLRKCLCNMFQIILKFHNTLRTHEWTETPKGYTHPSFNKLEQYYKAFCTMRSFPAQVVDKYSNSGYDLHLTRFVDALNINPLFSL